MGIDKIVMLGLIDKQVNKLPDLLEARMSVIGAHRNDYFLQSARTEIVEGKGG